MPQNQAGQPQADMNKEQESRAALCIKGAKLFSILYKLYRCHYLHH